jgi:regulator of sigma E protease
MPFAFIATLSMLIVLGIMVLVHEAGHFITAKLCGVRVEVFSIGFGKRIFGFRHGDTDYRLSLLPLGGYVKMAGEMPDGEVKTASSDPAEFGNRPRWQRMLIGFSGPISNFLLAFLLMTGLYMMHNEVDQYMQGLAVIDFVPQSSAASRAGLLAGDRIVRFDHDHNPTWQQVMIRTSLDANTTVPVTVDRAVNGADQQITVELPLANATRTSNGASSASGNDGPDLEALGLEPRIQETPLRIHEVTPDMPLAKAGVRPGDLLRALNGVPLHSTMSVTAYLQQNGEKPVDVKIARGDQTLDLNVTPILGDDGTGRTGYRLGFRPDQPPFTVEQLPLPEAARRSLAYNIQSSGYIVEVLRKLFSAHSNVKQLSGPIGIARVTGEAITMPGWQPIIGEMAMISLNLGIFNLLPFPILDGGMILLLAIEGVMRRDLNQQFKERIYQVAFVVLVLFAVFVMFNDVSKLSIFSKVRP